MAAYALEQGGKTCVTSVLRSNYEVVKEQGFNINSLQHGQVKGWRPSHSKQDLLLQHSTVFLKVISNTRLQLSIRSLLSAMACSPLTLCKFLCFCFWGAPPTVMCLVWLLIGSPSLKL